MKISNIFEVQRDHSNMGTIGAEESVLIKSCPYFRS